MNIKLDKLASGKWRYLSEPEITTLLDSVKASEANDQPVAKTLAPKTKPAESPDTKKEKLTVQKKAAPKPKEPGKKPKKSSYKEYRRNKR